MAASGTGLLSIRRCAIAGGVAAVSLMPVAASPPATAQAAMPRTIPALQEWEGTGGAFEINTTTRIAVTEAGLKDVADLFVDDVEEVSGQRLRVVGNPRRGDIVLGLGAEELPSDGYELTVTPDRVTVTAPTDTGVFLGTRTVLQLLVQDTRLPVGVARDWPRHPERGLMVDIGRKHLSVEWLEQHIRELAWLKMNVLHLHLSDNLGFRVESDLHPEIVSEQHLTKEQVRHLLAVAERHHVTVIPEIDMPGHMEHILAAHPEHQLVDALGQRNPQALDVTSDEARAFAREIIEEYLDLFGGEFWHGGADEYLHPLNNPILPAEAAYPQYPVLLAYAQDTYGLTAVHKDAYLDFINWMDELVRSHGRTLRVWSDGLQGGSAVTVNPGIVTEWWNWFLPNASPSELRAAGHSVVNAGWFPTYYATTSIQDLPSVRANLELAWDDWEVDEFWRLEDVLLADQVGIQSPLGVHDELDPDDPGLLGSKVHVWFDDPAFEPLEVTTANICPFLRLVAQKTWRSPTSEAWHEWLDTAAAIGRAPGFALNAPGACAAPTAVTLPTATVGPGAPGGMPATGGGVGLGILVVAAVLLLRRRGSRAWTSA